MDYRNYESNDCFFVDKMFEAAFDKLEDVATTVSKAHMSLKSTTSKIVH